MNESDIKREALPWREWTRVNYGPMAESIRDRLRAEQPKCQPSVGLMPDDTFIIWYRPEKCTWNPSA